MQRRKFLHIHLAALGGVLIGNHFSYAEAMAEMSDSFKQTTAETGYDLIINGAGLAGCFAAIEATKQGLKVLIIDKRTSPGFELTAKRRLWIKTSGHERFPKELVDLFFPEGEKNEIFNTRLQAPFNSSVGEKTLLFAGSIKKGLLRSLLVNKVDVLLMSDICGIISDQKTSVAGVIVACKQGVYTIPCNSFIDATDNNLFTRKVFGQAYKINRASFVMELQDVEDYDKTFLTLDSSYGISNPKIEVHQGKKSPDQYLLSFDFPVRTNDLSTIEQQARLVTARISKDLPLFDKSFRNTRLRYYAQECSYFLENNQLPAIPLQAYSCLENCPAEYSFSSITDMIRSVQHQMNRPEKQAGKRDFQTVYYASGKTCGYKHTNQAPICESGQKIPLIPYSASHMKLNVINSSLLVAGGGTAGTAVTLSAAEKGVKPLVVEYFNDLGGSKTMGGVVGYYLGQNKHPHILALEQNIREYAQEYNLLSNAICRCLYYTKALSQYPYEMINGAIICGAQTRDKQLEKVMVCVDGELKWIQTPLTIDATGDGDIAYFAGEKSNVGNSRMGITQNYSQWDLPFKSKHAPSLSINKDYDILDNTKITELQRGLYLSHYESCFYDLYPMLTVRESRRPEGVYELNLLDILDKKWFDDTIINAHSDFDPHHYGQSEYSRCAFLLPHSNLLTVNIPYRSIVPKTIDGLLLSGRGICQTHNALQFTRMSADVYLLGYVTGSIAAEIIFHKCKVRDFSVTTLQKEWLQNSILIENKPTDNYTIRELVNKLAEGEKEYLFNCCRKSKQDIMPLLINSYKKRKSILIAKALAWFGNTDGAVQIREELHCLIQKETETKHLQTYFEKYEQDNLYWQINQDIALLGMCKNKEAIPVINRILSHTNSGGKKVEADDSYNKNRIDLLLVPSYNRILNICFFIERIPDTLFQTELERLAADPNIRGQQTHEYEQTRWRIFGGLLELSVASALARCGSSKGMDILCEYVKDIHSDFRNFANQELAAIFNEDMHYEYDEWKHLIRNKVSDIYKTTPLHKEIEL